SYSAYWKRNSPRDLRFFKRLSTPYEKVATDKKF
ncbi:unnamed protein product, partial [marine sediment metagenome]